MLQEPCATKVTESRNEGLASVATFEQLRSDASRQFMVGSRMPSGLHSS
jgi:hypothetical protein